MNLASLQISPGILEVDSLSGNNIEANNERCVFDSRLPLEGLDKNIKKKPSTLYKTASTLCYIILSSVAVIIYTW